MKEAKLLYSGQLVILHIVTCSKQPTFMTACEYCEYQLG